MTSSYAFPILLVSDMTEFIKQRFPGIAYVTADDIRKPQMNSMKRIYSVFLQSLTGFDGSYQPRFGSLEDSMFADSIQEPLAAVVFSMALSKVMKDCGVDDVNLEDITSPTRKRTIRNLSALINFQRFVDTRIHIFEENATVAETMHNHQQQLMAKKHELDRKIVNLRAKKTMEEAKMRELLPMVEAVEAEIADYDNQQKKLTITFKELKDSIANNDNHLKQLREKKEEIAKDLENTRQKIVESPERLQQMLADISLCITNCRKETEDKRSNFEEKLKNSKKLSRCTDAIKGAKVLCNDTLNEIERYRETVRHYEDLVELRNEKNDTLRELNLNLQSLERGISSKRERLEGIKSNNYKKLSAMKRTLEDKRIELSEMKEKRREEDEEVSKLMQQIEAVKLDIEKSRTKHADNIKNIEKIYDDLLMELDNYHNGLAKAWEEVIESIPTQLE